MKNKGKAIDMKPEDIYNEMLQAGTGFMQQLPETLKGLEKLGYTANLTPKVDHFECKLGKQKLYPGNFVIDKIARFDSTSDPDGQSILYAVSSNDSKIKGVYVESFGPQSIELSDDMVEALKNHPH